ncbi:SGNH/GDSL hydrolase family protein [Verrucomicrobiota bacterium]
MKKATNIFKFNILVLVILMVILEVVLRVLGLGYGHAPLERHKVYHHVHPRNYLLTSYNPSREYGGFNIYYDDKRRACNPWHYETHERKTIKVAFLGDSFVEATQVSFGDSFVGRLEGKIKDINFVNYGVSGYSPCIYYLQAKYDMVEEDKPDHVVMVLYSNDVREDNQYLERAKYDDSGDLIAIDGGGNSKFVSLLRKSYFLRSVRKAQLVVGYCLKAKKAKRVIGGLVEEIPDISGTKTGMYILKTKSILDNAAIAFTLTVIPSKYSHLHAYKPEDEFAKKVKHWAENNNIDFVDLHSSFREYALKSEKRLFYEQDIHLNSKGHQVIADVFCDYFKSQYAISPDR